jgi:RND superfamily putative drug exporter
MSRSATSAARCSRAGKSPAGVDEPVPVTARVITAAATIMAVVFVTFAAVDDTLVKMIGVGLAAAVVGARAPTGGGG